jgi:hypothetical protein
MSDRVLVQGSGDFGVNGREVQEDEAVAACAIACSGGQGDVAAVAV